MDVGTEARLRNGALDSRPQRSITNDKSMSIGHGGDDALHRAHECHGILVFDERGHHHNQRRVVRDSKQTQRTTISSWNRSCEIDSARNYLYLLRVDPACDERPGYRFGYRDDCGSPTILEFGNPIAANPEIDSARDYCLRLARAKQRNRCRVSCVRVDDLNSFAVNESREHSCCDRIKLPVWCAGKNSQSELSCT